MQRTPCPECGKPKVHWRENNGQGCRVNDQYYCSQHCAGVTDRR